MFTVFSVTEAWVYSKTSHKEKRGRKLFLDLYAHYLRPNKVDHLSASLTCTLQNLYYHWEKKNRNSEKYQAAHLEQQNISVGREGHGYSGIPDRSKVLYLIDGINNDNLEFVKTQVIYSLALSQNFTGVYSLFLDYINQCESMNHPVPNISEVSDGSGHISRGGFGQGSGGRGGQGVRVGYKVPTPTSKEITACTRMSDKYLSDQNYKDLSPAEKARLWHIREKITGNDSNPSPPPSIINQVKSKISELKVTLCDLERRIDPSDKDKISVAMMITSRSIPATLH